MNWSRTLFLTFHEEQGDKRAGIAALVPRILAACCIFRGDFCFTITLLVIVQREALTLTDGWPFQQTCAHTHNHIHTHMCIPKHTKSWWIMYWCAGNKLINIKCLASVLIKSVVHIGNEGEKNRLYWGIQCVFWMAKCVACKQFLQQVEYMCTPPGSLVFVHH